VVEVSVEQVTDERTALDWQRVHNEIIPTDPLDLDQVRERSRRHHLEVLYMGEETVGCSTVRRPTDDEGAMVIARVLSSHRRQGLGELLYERGLAVAREWADDRPVETVVLASNEDGLAFALAHGFVEVDRYLLPGDAIPYVALQLAAG
jgi:predicted GNAT family N-acyltransferase